MPPTVKPKKAPKVQAGESMVYNPNTFSEHMMPQFMEVEDPTDLLQIIKPFEYEGRRFITFDTETHPHYRNSHDVPPSVVRRWVGTGKKATPQDYPFCISVCDGTHAVVVYDTVENNFEKFKQLAPLFEDPTVEKIAHNAKFDMHMIHNAKAFKIIGRIHDTVFAAKLADENRLSYKLVDLAKHTHNCTVKFEQMVDMYKSLYHVNDYRQIPHELMTQYSCGDVWNDFHVFFKMYEKLKTDELIPLYENETELAIALYASERVGMPVDLEYEGPLKHDLQEITDSAEAIIYQTAGKVFNINSAQQLYQVLISLGCSDSWIPRTEKGNPSLDKDVLNDLSLLHNVDIVNKILEYRKNEKLLNTYAYGIYEQYDQTTCVHCSVNQTEATTGRMSIVKPALQTLPKKDTRIRSMFIPPKGYKLYMMDLDQIEYRLFAHYAKAEGLIAAIKNGWDVHQATAALVFGVNYDDVTDDMRSAAKTINFALIYGQGDDHTSAMLKLSMTETKDFKARYFAQIPEAKPFIQTVHAVVRQRGYVKNFYGRRRRLDNEFAYKAPNALIQGCAADYIKHKMVNAYKYIVHNNLKSVMLLPVHDEVVFKIPEDEECLAPTFRWLLSDFTTFRCPITAGVDRGDPSWGHKEKDLEIGFVEPDDKTYLNYNVFDGHVFDIGVVA